MRRMLKYGHSSEVGVTKPISSVPLFSEFFSFVKTHVRYWISRFLYLTGIAAARLKILLTEKLTNGALVTPTPEQYMHIYVHSNLLARWRTDITDLQKTDTPLRWGHNERDGVSNRRRLDCSTVCSGADKKKTSKLRVTGLWEGNPLVTFGFPSQRAGDAENISIWWRYNAVTLADPLCLRKIS